MKIGKKLKSVVLTYEDEECVRLKGEEAIKFTDFIEKLYASYLLMSLKDEEYLPINLEEYFDYEVIRNPAEKMEVYN